MYFYTWNITLGPFIQEKISRGLHKTRTPRRNGTKSMFTAYSTKGRLEGFWGGLIQAAAYLGRESVRINALKLCPRLAEAVNDCCACSVFNYIPDLHGRETRVAVAGKWVLFTFTKWKMADRDSCKIRNVWSAPEEKQILLICSELEIAGTSRWNHPACLKSLSNLSSGFSHKFPNFLWPINYLGTQHQSWPKRQFKMKKTVKKTAFFTGQSHSFSFFACPSHSCELQTQLPQNEAPKQTTSSLDRSGHELSREPFIPAVRV